MGMHVHRRQSFVLVYHSPPVITPLRQGLSVSLGLRYSQLAKTIGLSVSVPDRIRFAGDPQVLVQVSYLLSYLPIPLVFTVLRL